MIYVFFFCCFLLVLSVSWIWVNGIDYMKTNYPDYKGEDFLEDYPPQKKKDDGWDDNKIHGEGGF